MREYKDILWTAFENTGSVHNYLKFKLFCEEKMKVEAGEEFGIDKNLGDCDQNDQVR